MTLEDWFCIIGLIFVFWKISGFLLKISEALENYNKNNKKFDSSEDKK